MHSCIRSKNVKWCHLIWPTLYIVGLKSGLTDVFSTWSSVIESALDNNTRPILTIAIHTSWYLLVSLPSPSPFLSLPLPSALLPCLGLSFPLPPFLSFHFISPLLFSPSLEVGRAPLNPAMGLRSAVSFPAQFWLILHLRNAPGHNNFHTGMAVDQKDMISLRCDFKATIEVPVYYTGTYRLTSSPWMWSMLKYQTPKCNWLVEILQLSFCRLHSTVAIWVQL